MMPGDPHPQAGERAAATPAGPPYLYFPAVEGFGETYRRVMLNDYFARLLGAGRLRHVAELPLDDYGVPGAGSLVFAQHGCQVSLVSDDASLLQAGQRVFALNGLEPTLRLVEGPLTALPLADDTFDLGWNFDRLLMQPDPAQFLREMARVCKAVFVCVPNARNYGQYAHYVYHRLRGDRCAYVEPRAWMARRPVRQVLESLGLQVVEAGVIDAPWWPGFPELPDLARRLLGRPAAASPLRQAPVPLETVEEAQHWLSKVQGASFIERSRLPEAVRLLFAHNVYVLAVKPQHRGLLG
jgi:SAM-dependent methyltransferase